MVKSWLNKVEFEDSWLMIRSWLAGLGCASCWLVTGGMMVGNLLVAAGWHLAGLWSVAG
jgi:hypothetical protein